MKYEGGEDVMLGDIVSIDMPDGNERATVVMLGEDFSYLEVDASYLSFVEDNNILKPDCIAVKWLVTNPLSHDDQNLAPVGDYMTTSLEGVQLIQRMNKR